MSDEASASSEASVRAAIKLEVQALHPIDDKEKLAIEQTLAWIDSGAELCRIKKPNVPDKHLVSYSVLIDGEHVLLVDHINAELWLPTGGHVEASELPVTAALRELKEELGITAALKCEAPLFLTSTLTVGNGPVHTDVSLWFVFEGDRNQPLVIDQSEFLEARWFDRNDIPLGRADPEMGRFLEKYYV